MRVLHITPSFHPAYLYGGTTKSVFDLCRGLADSGCEVRVLTTDANGPDSVLDVDIKHEVKLSEHLAVRYCHRIKDVSVSPALIRVLPGYMGWADIVHLTAVYSFPTIPTLALASIRRRPVVWSPRGMFQRWGGSTRTVLKGIWGRVCRLVSPPDLTLHFTSEEEQNESLGRFPGFRGAVIPNAYDVPDETESLPRDQGGRVRLLYLGRLDPKKGIENLVRACELLSQQNGLAWSLSIAGDGDASYKESVRRLIDGAALASKISMVGPVTGSHKEETLQHADVVVVPSHTENFGMVVAEALGHGVPVIASRGTPWSKVEEIGCGLWVDNSPQSLASAIRRIATMPLREMGERGRHWIAAEFSTEAVASRMLQLYGELTARPR